MKTSDSWLAWVLESLDLFRAFVQKVDQYYENCVDLIIELPLVCHYRLHN